MTKPISTITLLELRHKTEEVIRRVQAGEPLLLTKRGKPVLQLQPVKKEKIDWENDAFTKLVRSVAAQPKPKKKEIVRLTNKEIDRLIYGD
jgi:prevent-host-death family protein